MVWGVVSSTRNVSLELRSEHAKLTLFFIFTYAPCILHIVFISANNAQYVFYHNNNYITPYILQSNPHTFYSFRGLKNQMQIRFAVESWILEKR